MVIQIILMMIIIFLIIYIYKMKKEINYLCNQIDESNGEYLNIHTNEVNNSTERLAYKINFLYDNSQKVQAENKRIEEELRKSISNISHDLRTPLTSMIGYIQLIKDSEVTKEEREEYIDIIERRSKNLQMLISSFYDLSRLHSSEFKFDLKKINLNTILCDNIATYYNDFINKNIEPVIEIDEKIEDIISDYSAVNRIFSNLIGNMIKHVNEGMNVKIELLQDENHIISRFTNSAPNLREEDVEKLFDRFYTGDKSRNDKNTGLGLAITKELSKQLGNTITAKLINGKLCVEIIWKIKKVNNVV